MNSAPTTDQLCQLWQVCTTWRDKYQPLTEETVYQSDECILAAPELVVDVCQIVGYFPVDEEPEATPAHDPSAFVTATTERAPAESSVSLDMLIEVEEDPSLDFEAHLKNVRECLAYLEEWAEGDHYGSFNGGDPRLFKPDPECSTEEERAFHKAACEAWERGERPDIDHGPVNREEIRFTNKNGELVVVPPGTALVQCQVFGLGTVGWRNEAEVRLRDALRAALAEYDKATAEKGT